MGPQRVDLFGVVALPSAPLRILAYEGANFGGCSRGRGESTPSGQPPAIVLAPRAGSTPVPGTGVGAGVSKAPG